MTTRARRSRRGSGSRGGPRRKTQWVDTIVSFAVTAGGKSEQSLLSDLIPQDTQGMTLTRTLIHLWTVPVTDNAAIGANSVEMGIGLADQEAFAAAVLPDPETAGDEPSLGWVWRDLIVCHIPSDVALAAYEIRADIKSQRKIDNGELYFSATATNRVGTSFTVQVIGLIRCLFKLP